MLNVSKEVTFYGKTSFIIYATNVCVQMEKKKSFKFSKFVKSFMTRALFHTVSILRSLCLCGIHHVYKL